MAVITKITTQQKNSDRYNVFLDEKFAFSVDADILIKFQLKKGMELDAFSLTEIQYSDDIRKAYNAGIAYLARRIRSEKEIRDYLAKKDVEAPIANEVIHRLTSQNYLNDGEYAAAYVRTQMNTTDKGPDVIRMELAEKGIQKEIIQDCLREFTEELQVEKAKGLADKFFKKNAKDSFRILKQKLEGLLLRKGYSFDVIQRVRAESAQKGVGGDELEAIRYQGEKLCRKYSHYTGYEYEQKMKQALYRKGFTMDLIEKFLDEQKQS
ncbi:recombination regulator RecX [Neobacillus sp. SM06]|uniref:recombination regulator RecX n=1 Tax=Neobacillus sp. SM06 TaxID=3422492 RepID=UPI003D2B6AE0